jgi:hypothetical protein
MPSPFPGMDPYLEISVWPDFHTAFNTVMRRQLSSRLLPRYFVRLEQRVYVERFDAAGWPPRRPDLVVTAGPLPGREPVSASAAVLDRPEPTEGIVAFPEEQEEVYLSIETTDTHEVVTVIETLSPANKRPGSDGQREYLTKRELVLRSQAHFVELDLLRGGQRMPMRTLLPPCDYVAMISRADQRPHVQVYAWSLRQPLPEIRVPLLGDEETSLDLQEVVEVVYQEAGYEHVLDRSALLLPPVSDEDDAWIRSLTGQPEQAHTPGDRGVESNP